MVIHNLQNITQQLSTSLRNNNRVTGQGLSKTTQQYSWDWIETRYTNLERVQNCERSVTIARERGDCRRQFTIATMNDGFHDKKHKQKYMQQSYQTWRGIHVTITGTEYYENNNNHTWWTTRQNKNKKIHATITPNMNGWYTWQFPGLKHHELIKIPFQKQKHNNPHNQITINQRRAMKNLISVGHPNFTNLTLV